MALLIIDAGVTLCIVAIKGGGGWHSGLLEDCWSVTAVTSVIAVPSVLSAFASPAIAGSVSREAGRSVADATRSTTRVTGVVSTY